MKIAVPVTPGKMVDNHFGHCKYYNVYTISDDRTVSKTEQVPSPEGCGCKSDIAAVLAASGVKIMLAGGIGNGAITVLNREGIEVIRGCSGNSDSLVATYLSGKLVDSGESCHHHDAHHADGSHHQCSH